MYLYLATSADENFALPVTVMMRSVVDHLYGTEKVTFFILDCGITKASRRKMRQSVSRAWADIHFIPVGRDSFAGFRVDGHISAATYARLFLGRLLPTSIDRVIYLDGDLVTLADIRSLWETNLNRCSLAAVQDPVAGVVGRSVHMRHWDGWDVPQGTSIFNAGLMVIDLQEWRASHMFERAISTALEHPDRMKYWDQCALNYVIRGNYLELDPAWNVGPFVYYPPHCHDVVYDKETVARCIYDPKAIHYGGTWRPWKGPGRHWREAEFYRYLYRTAWRNDVYCAPWMGRGNTLWTKGRQRVKRMIRGTNA
ncbi:MAG: glycosyltransferase family 8 protein [Kiritimatiellia bacterium]|nr:glycosyltransferase family 8 protein [Kiritimatiellia bacterium]